MAAPFASPIFKGATRPACFLGVPIRPFIGTVGGLVLLGLWTTPPVALLAIPAVVIMRSITRDDDQRFRQIWIRLATRGPRAKNPLLYHGVSCFSPARSRRISDV